MNTRLLAFAASVAVASLLAACGSPRNDMVRDTAPQPRVISQAPVMNAPITSQYGYVTNVQTIALDSTPGRGGAVLGAVLGAVAGNQIGSGNGQKAAIAAGAVGGAVIGNQIQNRNKRDDEVYRVTVRFDDGHEGTYDFQQIDTLRSGDRVKYEGGQLYRL